jgi:hypothetical protein
MPAGAPMTDQLSGALGDLFDTQRRCDFRLRRSRG